MVLIKTNISFGILRDLAFQVTIAIEWHVHLERLAFILTLIDFTDFDHLFWNCVGLFSPVYYTNSSKVHYFSYIISQVGTKWNNKNRRI